MRVLGWIVVLFFLTTSATAEIINFKAELRGASEVPPSDSKGTATVDATFDTVSKKLSWKVIYSGLTGDATAVHFHGPADPYRTAPIILPFHGSLTSPIEGSAVVDQFGPNDFVIWYLNIHTAAHPGGEIRGMLTRTN